MVSGEYVEFLVPKWEAISYHQVVKLSTTSAKLTVEQCMGIPTLLSIISIVGM